MSSYRDIKAERPVRHFLAVTVFRAIWWPAVALAMPFAIIGGVVDWLSWTAFPWVAKTCRPPWGLIHTGALKLGNLILGYDPEKVR